MQFDSSLGVKFMHRLLDKQSRYSDYHSFPTEELRLYFDANIDKEVPLSPLFEYLYYILISEEIAFNAKDEIHEVKKYLRRKPPISDLESFKASYAKLYTLFSDILLLVKNDTITVNHLNNINLSKNLSSIQINCNIAALQLALFLNSDFSKIQSEKKLTLYLPYLVAIYVINGFPRSSEPTLATYLPQIGHAELNGIELEQAFVNLKKYFDKTAIKDPFFSKAFTLSSSNKSTPFEKHFINYQLAIEKHTVSNNLNASCKICKDLYYKLRIFCLVSSSCQNIFNDCDEDLSFILFSYQLFNFSNCKEFFIFFIFFFATTIIQVDYELYLETQERSHFYQLSRLFNKFLSIEHAFNSNNSTAMKYISQFFEIKKNQCTITIDNRPFSFFNHPNKDDYYISLNADPFTAILYTRIPIEYNDEPLNYYQSAPLLVDPQLYNVLFEHQLIKWQAATLNKE